MLKLWLGLEYGIMAIATHKNFLWHSRIAHGNVFEYSDGEDLFVIQFTYGMDDNNLMITRVIKKKPIKILFYGITGKDSLHETIEDIINGSLKDKFKEISYGNVSFLWGNN
jgi:hypothetical protein